MRKPTSERECTCGRIVKADNWYIMASGYQAWGFCTCGTTHAFDEWRDRK